MKIETAYEVGYQFWVPRVEWIQSEDSIYSNGKTYKSIERILKTSAKPKTLVRIVVTIEKNSHTIEYICQTGHDIEVVANQYGVYDPEYMKFTSEGEALEWAEKWKTEKGIAFFEH